MLKKLQAALLAATMVAAPALIAGVMYTSPAQAQTDKAQGKSDGGGKAAKSSDQAGQKSTTSSGSQSRTSSRDSASGSSSRDGSRASSREGSRSRVSVNARGGSKSKSRTDVSIRTRDRTVHGRRGGDDSYTTEVRHSGSGCYKMVRRHGHMTKVRVACTGGGSYATRTKSKTRFVDRDRSRRSVEVRRSERRSVSRHDGGARVNIRAESKSGGKASTRSNGNERNGASARRGNERGNGSNERKGSSGRTSMNASGNKQ
jgi:hypothetical protein